jgi:hypothetical protein
MGPSERRFAQTTMTTLANHRRDFDIDSSDQDAASLEDKKEKGKLNKKVI